MLARGHTWLSAGGRKSLPIVRQGSATECGLACVAMIAAQAGIATDLQQLRRQDETPLYGARLSDLAACCVRLGLETRAVRCSTAELARLKMPCILHWRFNHYVVLKAVRNGGVVLHDPARGRVVEPADVVREAFTGVALEVTRPPGLCTGRPPLRLRLRDLFAADRDAVSRFAAALLLAFITEVLLLTTPLYLQVIMDGVLARNDDLLLRTLAAAFTALMLIHVLASVLRQLTFNYLGHVAVFDITARVVRKLMSLPVRFFRSRELGDIQHRVQSLSRIQEFVMQSVPTLLLDLTFAVLIVALMFSYEATLTALILAVLGGWSAWRLLILPHSLALAGTIAQTESALQTHFLETLRNIQAIKTANGETPRRQEWCNLFAEATNVRIRASNLGVADSAVRQLMFQGARIAVIYLLAVRGLDGSMSVGMISAYVAYLGMLTARGSGIVDRLLEYKLLDVPLMRLSDIVFAEEEVGGAGQATIPSGDIEFRNVTFRYGPREVPVLKGCCGIIQAGSFVAIAGASGAGKSSLLQLIAGNETVSDGELLIGGRPASHWPPADLRRQMAAVFQGDMLFKGSVAENIALFDPDPDRRRIRSAARQAFVDREISALPMGYETRIGDLGSLLSRGQVQRVILARAIYRQPQLLLLDEATSGLDADLERRVIRSLAAMTATRVVVTHSDLMLQAADRVLWVHDGRLLSSRPDLQLWGPQ